MIKYYFTAKIYGFVLLLHCIVIDVEKCITILKVKGQEIKHYNACKCKGREPGNEARVI